MTSAQPYTPRARSEVSVVKELPPQTLKSLSDTLGTMPAGQIPVAWWSSTHPEVIKAYEDFDRDIRRWRQKLGELLALSGLPADTRLFHRGSDTMIGFTVPPQGAPEGWRVDKGNHLVPRQRTKAEREGQIFTRFKELQPIPRAVDYLPGMPHTLWMDDRVFFPQVFRPAIAVLVFIMGNPAKAAEPFIVGEQWTEMKMSTFHLLREYQNS
jgi:hypothetical protein